MGYTLGKEEKLKSKKAIEHLFVEGYRIKSHPFQLIFLQKEHNAEFPIKVGFAVPKRTVKLAVNRNRIKRLMREVYRKNKQLFSENLSEKYLFMLIYSAHTEVNYIDLELSIKKICTKFLNKIHDDEKQN
ncbi:MAG: ribonuclease P protein component [Lutibacter sp.]|nr:MAG: ribonuclease P protein component [Lutibacter sp.]PHS52781.1 MAG: ribonuclease P protein component [Lutibacter sp.]